MPRVGARLDAAVRRVVQGMPLLTADEWAQQPEAFARTDRYHSYAERPAEWAAHSIAMSTQCRACSLALAERSCTVRSGEPAGSPSTALKSLNPLAGRLVLLRLAALLDRGFTFV